MDSKGHMLVVIGRVRPILFVSCSQSLLIFIVIMIDENAVISRFVNGMSLKDMEVLCNVYMVVLMIFFMIMRKLCCKPTDFVAVRTLRVV